MTGWGYRCRGHCKASGYIEESVPLTPEQQAELKAEQERKAAEKKAKWEASRWFRPIEAHYFGKPREQHPFFQGLSDVTLAAVFSMIGEGVTVGDATDRAKEPLWAMAHLAVREVMDRKVDWPVGYYNLTLAPEWDPMRPIHLGNRDHAYYNPFDADTLTMDLTLLADDHLMVLYGAGAQVVDYSCLERGARQVGEHVWLAASEELKRRGLEPVFLMEWE